MFFHYHLPNTGVDIKTEGNARDFQNLPKNVVMANALITMFDHCYCMNSMIYSLKFTKSIGLYFVAVSVNRGLNVFIKICVPMRTNSNTNMIKISYSKMKWPGSKDFSHQNLCIITM